MNAVRQMATPSYVEIVHVTSRQKQQEVLRLFRDVAGLTAMGVSTGQRHSVVFGCLNSLMKSAAEVLLAELDPDAVCTHVSGPRVRSQVTPGRAASAK
jgi:hypothetical protein